MIPWSNSFKISFITTSFMVGFSLRCGFLTGLASSFSKILCMQIAGFMPFISAKVNLIAVLFSLKTLNNFSSLVTVRSFAMITSNVSHSPKYTYFKCWAKTSIPTLVFVQQRVKPFHEN